MIGANHASERAPTSNLGLPRRRGARRGRVRRYARSRPGDRPWNGQHDWSERHYGLFSGGQRNSMSTVAQLAHSPRQLCKVRIELDLSKNSRLKVMYRQPEFHREIAIYLRQYDLEISNESANPQGRVTSIEVTGPAAGLRSFVDCYLPTDAFGIAYSLDYV